MSAERPPNEKLPSPANDVTVTNTPGAPPTSAAPPDGTWGQTPDELDSSARASKGALFIVPGYEILEELGQGGMGIVYRARELRLKREVALKTIHIEYLSDAKVITRFVDEAHIVAQLQHPAIAPIHDFGTLPDGRPFFTMKWVKGDTLQDLLQGRPAPSTNLFSFVQIFESMCDCLAYAHEHHVLHRDLKPGNVMVDERFHIVHVMDWGIGKVRPAASEGDASAPAPGTVINTPRRSKVESTDGALGTYAWMPPEQANGLIEQIDARSDVFGLGAILCEILTGQPPYWSEHPSREVCCGEIRFAAENGDTKAACDQLTRCGADPDLIKLAQECLQKDRERRPANARAVLERIQMYRREQEEKSRKAEAAKAEAQAGLARAEAARAEAEAAKARVQAGKTRTLAYGLAGIALLLLLGLVVFAKLHSDANRERNKAQEAAGKLGNALAKLEKTSQEKLSLQKSLLDMRLAPSYWEGNRIGWLLKALDGQRPENTGGRDIRGFEWYFWRHRCLNTMRTFELDAQIVIYSPNGKQIACRDADSWYILDASTGQELISRRIEEGNIDSMTYSSDGKLVAVGSNDDNTRLWKVQNGELKRTLKGQCAAFHPDGRHLATGSSDGIVRVWDIDSEKEKPSEYRTGGKLNCVAYSADGGRLAAAGALQGKNPNNEDSGSINIWDLANGGETTDLSGRTREVTEIAFSPNGKTLAAASSDSKIRLWDAATGASPRLLEGHQGRVNSVVFSPDGQCLASGSADQTVRVWDAAIGEQILILRGHTDGIYSVAFSPDGQHIASAGGDRTVRIWDAINGQAPLTLTGHQKEVYSVAFNQFGHIATGSEDGTAKLWDASTGQTIRALPRHTASVNGVAFSPDGQLLATASDDNTVIVWEVKTGREKFPLKGHTKQVWAVVFSPDGSKLASVGEDSTLRLWDAHDGQQIKRIDFQHAAGASPVASGVAFSPDGKRLAVACWDTTVRICDVETGQEKHNWPTNDLSVWWVAFSPKGDWLATASNGSNVKLWNAETGALLRTFRGHTGKVSHIVFSPDGQRLASASWDGTVKLWEVGSGEETLTLQGHGQRIFSVAFSPDGQKLASTNVDGSVQIWEAPRTK